MYNKIWQKFLTRMASLKNERFAILKKITDSLDQQELNNIRKQINKYGKGNNK